MHKTGLFWFTNDLRIEDNRALLRASQEVEQLLCVYIVETAWFKPDAQGLVSMGAHRWRFLHQTLVDLQASLAKLGQTLLIIYESALDALAQLISVFDIAALYRSQNAGYYENYYWQTLKRRYGFINFEELATHTLFSEKSLPFARIQLPDTFSRFRQLVEQNITSETICAKIVRLPPRPKGELMIIPDLPPVSSDSEVSPFHGGASDGHKHIQQYFSSRLPGHYKQTKNALDGWQSSTKFSPWLANGSLSVRQIIRALKNYETQIKADKSTDCITSALLRREYFHWYAHVHRERLFAYTGIKRKKILSSFYPERFARWRQGNTPYPLVNACMKQLNATGYMSVQGREIVASCLINELNLNWRLGAAYFEQQLIDYDVALNWGNWQYLAGVGADPQDKHHFDLDKQTTLYDPEGAFIAKWQGDIFDGPLDSVDAADWPVSD